jgi:ribosomal protein L35AE/L33A
MFFHLSKFTGWLAVGNHRRSNMQSLCIIDYSQVNSLQHPTFFFSNNIWYKSKMEGQELTRA